MSSYFKHERIIGLHLIGHIIPLTLSHSVFFLFVVTFYIFMIDIKWEPD